MQWMRCLMHLAALLTSAQTAVLRSYSANGNFNIFLTAPHSNARTKIEVKTIRPYNDERLHTVYHLTDGTVVVPIVTIADMDTDSAVSGKPNLWYSPSARGYVSYNTAKNAYNIVWLSQQNYTFGLNFEGRGMELSDLTVFDGHLLAPDDKTGVVYRLTNNQVIPWVINADGSGEQSALFKGEWMTVKSEELYVGGYGKEYTDRQGRYLNSNPMWVKIISRFGEVRSENWEDKYKRLRAAVGVQFPGFMIHESSQWSEIHKKWFFLPRKMSFEAYNAQTEEVKGTNLLLMADENFTNITSVKIGNMHETRGFSAFQFLPETNDTLIIALKTEEVEGLPIASYCMLFNIDGTVLIDELKMDGHFKFEGIEFIDWNR